MLNRIRAIRAISKGEGICAFCGADLDLNAPGAVWITLGSTRNDSVQGLYAHASCIAEQLDPQVPFHEGIFEPD